MMTTRTEIGLHDKVFNDSFLSHSKLKIPRCGQRGIFNICSIHLIICPDKNGAATAVWFWI